MGIRFSMAMGRNDFIEALYNKMDGGLGEHYKIVVAELISKPDDIAHWEYEVNAHLQGVYKIMLRSTKTRFDKMKAFDVAMVEVRQGDRATRQWALDRLRGEKYRYVVPKQITIDHPAFEQAAEDFYGRARSVAQSALKF